MSNRESISVTENTFLRIQRAAAERRESMAKFVENRINEYLDSMGQTITDEDINVFREESRACGDQERARAASAALGLPVGDGALGLLDRATCRARVTEIILRERTPGTSAERKS